MNENNPSHFKQGRWTIDEQRLFNLVYQWHGKDWKRLSEALPTRNIKQIRSHAQKFQKKFEKTLSTDSLPQKIYILDTALNELTNYISQTCSASYKKYIECQNLLMYSQSLPLPSKPCLSPSTGELSHN